MELVNMPNRNVKEKRMANTIESVLMGRFSIDETRSSMGVMIFDDDALLAAAAAATDDMVVLVSLLARAAVIFVVIVLFRSFYYCFSLMTFSVETFLFLL